MLLDRKQFKILYGLLMKQDPQIADVIIWLQGDRYDRAYKTLRLYKEGWGRQIVITGNDILVGSNTRLGENNIKLDEMKAFLLKRGVNRRDIVMDGNAMNTKDQAEHLIKMAIDKGWSKLILVGSSYYQPRAFLTFLKQIKKNKWRGQIINQSALIGWDKKPSGRKEIAKNIFWQEFDKVKKYKKDLASMEQGIKYLSKDV